MCLGVEGGCCEQVGRILVQGGFAVHKRDAVHKGEMHSIWDGLFQRARLGYEQRIQRLLATS